MGLMLSDKRYDYKGQFNEFLEYFIGILENEILPKILKEIELPLIPSIAKIKNYEFKSKRAPNIAKKRFEIKDPYRKSNLIQKFASLKDQLDGHEINETLNPSHNIISNNNSEMLKKIISESENPYSLKTTNLKQINMSELTDIKTFYGKSLSINEIEKERFVQNQNSLKFDDQIKIKILNDNLFMKFISEIEVLLNKYIKLNSIKLDCQIYINKDFEVPELEKIILSINVENKSVEEKLDFWDDIDNYLRKNIELSSEFLKIDEKSKYMELNSFFFTNIELS